MATTVTSELTLLETADVPANFTRKNPFSYGKGSALAAPTGWVPVKSGSYVLATNVDNADAECYHDTFTAVDLSGTHFWVWGVMTEFFNCGAFPATTDISGIFVGATDGTNWGYWNLDGRPGYGGEYKTWVVDLGSTPDANEGTDPDMSNCTGIGIGFYNDVQNSKATYNAFFDFLRTGNGGLKIITTSSTVADFDAIVAGDATIFAGLFTLTKEGVYRAISSLRFGDTSSGDMEFLDTEKVVVWPDLPVATDLYGFVIEGNASGTIKFQLGTKSGTRGIRGCQLLVPGAQRPDFTATDTDIDELKLYGCLFSGWGDFLFPVTASGRECLDTTFGDCGLVSPSTMVFKFANFIDALATAVIISSTSHALSDSSFINCPTAIEIDTAGTYTFTNVICSGCTVDIDNSVDATTRDSYADTNRDGDQQISGGSTNDAVAQSFPSGAGGDLANVEVMLSKSGTPTGSAYAEVYAHSGTYGTSSVPTGAALATSDPLDVSTLDGTPTLTRFNFSGTDNITLSATYYCVVIRYEGGDASNYILVGRDGSSPGHGGNLADRAVSGGAWTADNAKDLVFYLRVGGIVVVNNTGGAIVSHDETGSPPGATTINNSRNYTLTGLDTGSAVVIVRESDGEELFYDTETAGTVTYSYNYTGDVDVFVQILDLNKEVMIMENVTLGNTSVSIPVTQSDDSVYSNP
jgi:hypothetical protein